ncbi:hypothetical protein CMI47_04810 [Candidatus Pacearchaeota archaeon]|nr:hypothetical protein [Candidatus Pacearchaeota archaeon]|tara:strand:+ start:1494 stop:1730 length:237 start_codon:yes stop_codon:yes gene_type:complete
MSSPHEQELDLLYEYATGSKFAIETGTGGSTSIMGHHRVGSLLALGINFVKVVVAKDAYPGTCQCYGRIHDIYSGIKG